MITNTYAVPSNKAYHNLYNNNAVDVYTFLRSLNFDVTFDVTIDHVENIITYSKYCDYCSNNPKHTLTGFVREVYPDTFHDNTSLKTARYNIERRLLRHGREMDKILRRIKYFWKGDTPENIETTKKVFIHHLLYYDISITTAEMMYDVWRGTIQLY